MSFAVGSIGSSRLVMFLEADNQIPHSMKPRKSQNSLISLFMTENPIIGANYAIKYMNPAVNEIGYT